MIQLEATWCNNNRSVDKQNNLAKVVQTTETKQAARELTLGFARMQ